MICPILINTELVPTEPQGSFLCLIISVPNIDCSQWCVGISDRASLGYVPALSIGVFRAQIFFFNKIVLLKMTTKHIRL